MTPSPNEITRAILTTVAHADQERRARTAVRKLAQIAPFCAAFVLVIAAIGRWLGWRPLLPLGLLAIAAVGLAAFVLIARRARATTDALAARVDDDANLRGELRSAHWFATEGEDGKDSEWPQFHLQRAAAKIGGMKNFFIEQTWDLTVKSAAYLKTLS